MPSPRTTGLERRFIIKLLDGQTKTLRAEDKGRAKAKIIRDILSVRADLSFKEASKLIEACHIDPRDKLPVGRPKGGGRRKPRDENDHSTPHW